MEKNSKGLNLKSSKKAIFGKEPSQLDQCHSIKAQMDGMIVGNYPALERHPSQFHSVVYAPDGSQIASASYDHTVRLWETASGKCTQTLTGHTNDVNCVVYAPDGSQIASASDDHTVRVWSLDSEAQVTGVRVLGRHTILDCAGADCRGVKGLTLVQQRLIEEKGGRIALEEEDDEKYDEPAPRRAAD